MTINPNIPQGALPDKWQNYKESQQLVSPANKRKLRIIVVGTGLAGASAASTLGQLGFAVDAFCLQDSPRRAHSIAAQGGINAAKNYQNDGDSVERLFRDTLKGGDYRAREANVYRLAQLSNNIIDLCVAQGVPFAREYGGQLANRSFGGAQVSRTFYARGQTGQQLLLGAYGALSREVARGTVTLHTRHEMLELVTEPDTDGTPVARGIITRNLVTGQLERHAAHAVVIASGGYGNVYHLSTNALGSNVSAAWACHRKGALFANPCFVQIHPTCIPMHGDYQSKLTLMSESLRNDGRIWVPRTKQLAEQLRQGTITANDIPADERDYYLERRYPAFGNLVPRDVASRAAKERCDAGFGVAYDGNAVFLDFADAIARLGKDTVSQRYGNLFSMYHKIVDQDPYSTPMIIYPAVHYTMGGLWVDYQLQTTVRGLFAAGEANFSDHGANRLGASALMQGLADGYFILPYTLQNYLASHIHDGMPSTDTQAFAIAHQEATDRIAALFSHSGYKPSNNTPADFHRRLGNIMWQHCGMARSKQSLTTALQLIGELSQEFHQNLHIPGSADEMNPALDQALHVADYIPLASLIATDALLREESCGGHFRVEHQTPDGETLRDDEHFMHVAAWQHQGSGQPETRLTEPLSYQHINLSTRNYK